MHLASISEQKYCLRISFLTHSSGVSEIDLAGLDEDDSKVLACEQKLVGSCYGQLAGFTY